MDEEHWKAWEVFRTTQAEIATTQVEIRNARVGLKAELAELSRIVFGHATDRDALTRS